MLAVKNWMKRRLARSPGARTIVGNASRPARMSAGGGTISSVRMIGCLATIRPLPSTAFFLAHKAHYVLQTSFGGRVASAPPDQTETRRGLEMLAAAYAAWCLSESAT